ncbi:MAG: hypothetical protein JW730_07065 [Anaerolineales bacterium]|nr:hypothetical protein [Anaerolineales bacterium]
MFKSIFKAFKHLVLNERGDDYGEKAVILVLVVLAGVGAFSMFGGKVVELITRAASGI